MKNQPLLPAELPTRGRAMALMLFIIIDKMSSAERLKFNFAKLAEKTGYELNTNNIHTMRIGLRNLAQSNWITYEEKSNGCERWITVTVKR